MLDNSLPGTEQIEELKYPSEIRIVARSIVIGLVIAGMAIGVGPVYGIIIAAGITAVTLAGAAREDNDRQFIRYGTGICRRIGVSRSAKFSARSRA